MDPATQEVLAQFTFADLPEAQRAVAQSCAMLAEAMASQLDSDEPQVQDAVRDGLCALFEARQCFVQARQWMTAQERPEHL